LFRRSVRCSQGGGDVPIIPSAHYLAVAHLDHAHYGDRYYLASRWQAAQWSGVLEPQAKTDSYLVFDPEDIVNGEMRFAESGEQCLRGGTKGLAAVNGGARAGEIVRDHIGGQKLVDRFEPALVPQLFKPTAHDRGVFVLNHFAIMRVSAKKRQEWIPDS
jgi:hypothetical protein